MQHVRQIRVPRAAAERQGPVFMRIAGRPNELVFLNLNQFS